MPGRNNTTPIGDGSVGLNNEVVSVAGKMIDTVISENNLRAAISYNDPQYSGLFRAVTNMVSRWLPQDKARILQEYGNLQGLPKNAKGNELDKYVAITLISRLPKNELVTLVKKSSADSINLSGDMRKAEAKAAAYAKKQTNAVTKNTIAELQAQAQDSGSATEILKSIDAKLGGIGNLKLKNGAFYIDKYSQEAIAGLRKELDIVLKNYTDGYLSKLLYLLNIENDEGQTSKHTLRKRINNIINCYVAVMIGKTKGIHASAFSPEAVAEIDKILSLTSFGYLTGKVGLGDSAIIEKRKDAAKALKKQNAFLKNLKAKEKIKKDSKGNIKVAKKSTGNADLSSGVKQKGYTFKPTREFASGKYKKFYDECDKQIIEQFKITDDKIGDPDGLRNLAVSFGITDAATANINKVRVQVTQLLALEQYSLAKDMADAIKLKDPKKRIQKANEVQERTKNSMTTALYKQSTGANLEQETSDKIPVVSFNGNGNIISEGITKAVPVVLMDSAVNLTKTENGYEFNNSNKKLKLGTVQTTKEAQITKGESVKADDVAEKYAGDALARQFSEYSNKLTNKLKFASLKNDKTGYFKNNKRVEKATEIVKDFGWNIIQKEPGSTTESQATPSTTVTTTPQATPTVKKKRERKTVDRGDFKISNITNYRNKLSNIARTQLKDDAIESGVIPVIDLNKTHDFFRGTTSDINATNLVEGVDKIATNTDGIQSLVTAFSSLQSVGTSVNAAGAGGAIAMATTIANEIAEQSVDIYKNLVQKAVGGSARRVSESSSSLITGDARRGTGNKANPELVNIDWNRKQVNVQPIPMMATGGTTQKQESNSNLKTTSRMTAGERNKPLSVGISNGLVTYNKALQDVTDDGSGTAVKVYSINSGIHEKVKVGESEVSLFDAVYGIYSTIAVMSANSEVQKQLLSTIATTAATISSTTSKIANSSNSSSSFSFPSELDGILSGN